MPSLHHELAVDALLAELDALVDHVLVAALEAEVAAAEALNEVRQRVARHAVRHDCGAWVLPATVQRLPKTLAGQRCSNFISHAGYKVFCCALMAQL